MSLTSRFSLDTQLFASLRFDRARVVDLLVGWWHSAQVRRQRRALLVSRVQLMAVVFAVLVPLWIVPDVIAFPAAQWLPLAGMRLASSVVFLLLAYSHTRVHSGWEVSLRLGVLLTVPTVFHVLACSVLLDVPRSGFAGVLLQIYALLPFVVVAGLAVFPLTGLETLLYALPIFAAFRQAALITGEFSLPANIGTLWLLLLVTGVAMVSGMSQLQYMIALVRQASADALTGALNRHAGVETLELLFRVSASHNTPLALMFVDLDHFKQINDGWGHEAGDAVLRGMAAALRGSLRRGDVLVRWGGEEFLVILNHTDVSGARLVVNRLRHAGLGQRPDGSALTASIGVAERLADSAQDWPELVDLADQRMYAAKEAGRDRAVLPQHTAVPC